MADQDESTEILPPVIEGQTNGGATSAGWHAIAALLMCQKEYQLRHVRGISKPVAQDPDHFAIGKLFHAGRARWFTLRFASDAKAWESIQAALEHEMEVSKLPMSKRAESYALMLVHAYAEYWSKRPLPKPVATEYLLGPAPIKDGDPLSLHRTARLDDASHYPEAGGALCIGEAKTTSDSVNACINEYTLHGQPLLQLLLWHFAPQGEATYGPVRHVVLDVVKKPYGKDKPAFARHPLVVQPQVLEWYTTSMRRYLQLAASIDWNADATRNPALCTRLAGKQRVPCEYRDLCLFGREASGSYVMRGGKSLLSHKKTPEESVNPWD